MTYANKVGIEDLKNSVLSSEIQMALCRDTDE
jgi:hypothetical protein